MKNYQVMAALVLGIINQALTQENQIKAAWCGCMEQQLNETTNKRNGTCINKLLVNAAKVAQEIGNGTQASDVKNWVNWVEANENTVKCDPQDETKENIKEEVKEEVMEGLSTFQIASATVGGILLVIIVAISLIVIRSLKFKPNAVPKKSENPEAIEMTSIVETRTVPVAAETRVIVETLI